MEKFLVTVLLALVSICLVAGGVIDKKEDLKAEGSFIGGYGLGFGYGGVLGGIGGIGGIGGLGGGLGWGWPGYGLGYGVRLGGWGWPGGYGYGGYGLGYGYGGGLYG